jgi:lysozyme
MFEAFLTLLKRLSFNVDRSRPKQIVIPDPPAPVVVEPTPVVHDGRMRVSDAGLEMIKRAEGCVLHIYKDQAGLDTIGVGHLLTEDDKRTGRFKGGITEKQALDLLRADVGKAEAAVNDLVSVSISQARFDVLVDFVFNVGVNAFRKSTLLRRLNSGDYDVADEFLKWTKVRNPRTGQLEVSKGLLRRRQREADHWRQG